jgi:hypothetical protein
MDLNILHIWETMSILSKIVAITLVVMGIGTAYVTIERMIVLGKAFASSAVFAKKSRPLLDELDIDSLIDLAKAAIVLRSSGFFSMTHMMRSKSDIRSS